MATLAHSQVAQNYAKTQIETASKAKAISMLHERCVQCISLALDTPAEKKVFIVKAQNILCQLQLSLIVSDAVAQSLFYLYDYSYVLLEKGDDKELLNAGSLLATLRDTFKFLAKRPRARL